MQLRIFTEPQMGATYDDLLAVARRTEETGFDAFFRSDHYLTMGGDGLPGPTDAWVTLAGLARETSRIRLGTMVTAATFRLPGPLAIAVAQVDQMSGGRVELGLGAGWYDDEHTAYGIPFPPVKERFDRYEEQLAILTGLWAPRPARRSTSTASTTGCGLAGAAQAGPGRRHPGHRRRQGQAAHAAAGRPVRGGVQRAVRDGGGERPAVRRRAGGVPGGRARPGVPGPELGADRSASAGTTPRSPAGPTRSARTSTSSGARAWPARPAEVVDQLGALAEVGAQRAYLQVLDLADLDHLDLIASEVAPQLG